MAHLVLLAVTHALAAGAGAFGWAKLGAKVNTVVSDVKKL